MMKGDDKVITYIFSGFDVREHFGTAVSKCFKDDMKDYSNIAFIPGEFNDKSKVERYVGTDVEWFKEIGINLNKVIILNDEMDSLYMNQSLINSDIIFIMGGNTQKQNEFLEKNKLKETIKNFKGIVIGVSAGAINLGKTSICSKDPDDGVEKTEVYNGIGRINFTIEPHFDINNVNLLNEELYPNSKQNKIYGLPNDTGVKIIDNSFEIIKGKFYEIYNDSIEEL